MATPSGSCNAELAHQRGKQLEKLQDDEMCHYTQKAPTVNFHGNWVKEKVRSANIPTKL